MRDKLLTDDDVRRLVAAACDRAGGCAGWAREIGEHRQVVSLYTCGGRAASPRMLEALGLRQVRRYERVG